MKTKTAFFKNNNFFELKKEYEGWLSDMGTGFNVLSTTSHADTIGNHYLIVTFIGVY
jgi:hypothetical protein